MRRLQLVPEVAIGELCDKKMYVSKRIRIEKDGIVSRYIQYYTTCTFEVLQERLSGNDCKATVEMRSGACSHCELSKFCVHVSAVACLYPESMVSMYFIIITETSVCREWTCR